MFEKIIQFSLSNKLLIGLGTLAIVLGGIYYGTQIPLDAVPDITNNQVQIVSTAPTFAPQEVEQLITFPLEAAMTNLPKVQEVRSISRYGLSVITVVFDEDLELLKARQYCKEQLDIAKGELPSGIEPELMPITTGLGEIYQYVITVDSAHTGKYDLTELRTIQDWIVKRQLNGTKGVIETSSFGGYMKQYEVAINPMAMQAKNINTNVVLQALQHNNANSGGSYIEQGPNAFYIRTEGRTESLEDIANTLITNANGTPITIGNIAKIQEGSAKRYGAMTMDGKGEVVGGITLMLKGANTSEVLENVKIRLAEIEPTLPPGVGIYPYLDRSKLIGKTIHTVSSNLLEGGLIVIFILFLILGNFRAGIIVATVIPLSLFFAMICMHLFGISANLMSLGAIDFGIVVDGAVIIVESVLHVLTLGYLGKKLSQVEMDGVILKSTTTIYRTAAFGVLIILLVFIPILTLEGVEGKTFIPMAQTVSFAIFGSLVLSITYVPVMASLILNKSISNKKNKAEIFIDRLNKSYQPVLSKVLDSPKVTLSVIVLALAFSVLLFNRMGAEFTPTLEEGDLAMQLSIKPGSSLQESIHTSTQAESILMKNFPEVLHVVSKIGTAEVPTDPMAIEDADVMIILKEKEEWTTASTREELVEKMKEKLSGITWASMEFTQPIQLRFNELMTGSKSDISVKIFGENPEILKSKGDELAEILDDLPGAADIKVDQTEGLQQLTVKIDRHTAAKLGVHVDDINTAVRTAFAGEAVGAMYENERKFDIVVRYDEGDRQSLDLQRIMVANASNQPIPLSAVAQVVPMVGPMLISREQAQRFINVGINVRNTDVATLVENIQERLDNELKLPPGYIIKYGGQFENLQRASKRLMVAVPIALFIIFILLYLAFASTLDAAIIFMAVPLSAVGGILALVLRDMPFSISSGIGFIALFGVSVLNGIVLISSIKNQDKSKFEVYKDLIIDACTSRLRPILITALVAALGFMPMAFSSGSGAEVQRPLATVVIGGLVSSTLLTLVILPLLYFIFNRKNWNKAVSVLALLVVGYSSTQAQVSEEEQFRYEPDTIQNFENLYERAAKNNLEIKRIEVEIKKVSQQQNSNSSWAPTELSYSGGQINSGVYDNQLNINQDLSPLLQKNKWESLAQNQIQMLENEKTMALNTLKYHLLKEYTYWQFADAQYHYYMLISEEINNLVNVVESKYKNGAIDALEWVFAKNELAKIQTDILHVETEKMLHAQAIYKLAFLPGNTPLKVEEFSKFTLDGLHFRQSVFSDYYTAKASATESNALVMQKLNNTPSLSAGYFHQSLEKQFGFQGVNLGIAIPIDRSKASAAKQIGELEKNLVLQEQTQVKQDFDLVLLQELRKQKILAKSESIYIASFLEENKKSMQRLNSKLTEGEIDAATYGLYLQNIINTEINYLTWILNTNLNTIEIAYHTQSK